MRLISVFLLHFAFLGILYSAYRIYTEQPVLPSEKDLSIVWDGYHYTNIKNDGYSYNPARQSNVAFFPGFPYLWKYSGLNAFGISLINLLLFLTGLFFLVREFAIRQRDALLFLSLPSLFFMFVPYSEALFFAASSILLIGL